ADQARLMCDAVVRTLARLLVTRRRLLEWETARIHRATAGDGAARFPRWHVGNARSGRGKRRGGGALAAVGALGREPFSGRLVPLAGRGVLGQPSQAGPRLNA